MLSRFEPDVLVVDLRLPEVDGTVLARKRTGSTEPATVLVSAEPVAGRVAEELGVPFIPKPFDIGALIETVDELASCRR
jgi:DNA-binding response OmpR family regulator